MVMLAFSEKLGELLTEFKLQTIRWNLEYWQYLLLKSHGLLKLDMWWQNPRTCRPDCYKMGIAYLQDLTGKLGEDLTEEDAKKDSFDNLEELLICLEKKHNVTTERVLTHTWAILTYKWKDGPKIDKTNPIHTIHQDLYPPSYRRVTW